MTKSMETKKTQNRANQVKKAKRMFRRMKRNQQLRDMLDPVAMFTGIIIIAYIISKVMNFSYAGDIPVETIVLEDSHLIIDDSLPIEEMYPPKLTKDFVYTDEEMVQLGLIDEDSLKIIPSEGLDGLIQQYMQEKSEEWDIPFEILLAIAKKESGYNPNAISSTNDHGLMQINAGNFKFLRSKGISDWYDPYQSIDAACILLNEMRTRYNLSEWSHILMVYNMGYSRASKLWESGSNSSSYSRTVLNYASSFGY